MNTLGSHFFFSYENLTDADRGRGSTGRERTLGEEWPLPELGPVGSSSVGGWCAEKKQDVFPTVRIGGAMMLMNGERESMHLTSAVGERSTASPSHPSFLELTGRMMQKYAPACMDGMERSAFGWLGLCGTFPVCLEGLSIFYV